MTDETSRADVSHIMDQFRSLLGDNWDNYRYVLTHFLTGRLTRSELQEDLDKLLQNDQKLVQLHNRFLLANLANALQDAPGSGAGYAGWGYNHKDELYAVQADGQFAKLKDDIMSLSVRERKRIKQIAKEPSDVPNLPPTILATRQAMLPKIPLLNTQTIPTPKEKPEEEEAGVSSSPTTYEATEADKSKNTQSFTQDIIAAYEAPLATDTYELPDSEALGVRMLGVALENGLINGIDPLSAEVMLAALEYYLKGLVQTAFDTVKRRRVMSNRESSTQTTLRPNQIHDPEDIITVQDISRIVESSPSYLVEVNGPFFRMNDTMLMDDDEWAKLSGQAFAGDSLSVLEDVNDGDARTITVGGSDTSDHNLNTQVKVSSIGMGISTSQARLIAAVSSSSGPHANIDSLLDAIVADGMAK